MIMIVTVTITIDGQRNKPPGDNNPESLIELLPIVNYEEAPKEEPGDLGMSTTQGTQITLASEYT